MAGSYHDDYNFGCKFHYGICNILVSFLVSQDLAEQFFFGNSCFSYFPTAATNCGQWAGGWVGFGLDLRDEYLDWTWTGSNEKLAGFFVVDNDSVSIDFYTGMLLAQLCMAILAKEYHKDRLWRIISLPESSHKIRPVLWTWLVDDKILTAKYH